MRTRAERDWIIAPQHPDRARLAREAGVDALVAQVLLNRGIQSGDEARRFLAPDFRALLPPDKLPNAIEAGRRLARAAADGRRIVIYGDYDVDGVTATAILWHVLRLAGARVSCYIPKRLDEGYGINADALARLAADGAQLVVSVDCGVTAVEEAARARELGLELIITDHHEPRAALPAADLLVHPTALGPSENPHLSGAGVALKVAWAVAQHLSQAQRVREDLRVFLMDATAFAALGLVADVVPLVGENRVIATFGLRQLTHTRNLGLRALIEVSGLSGKASYDDYDVGFMLAPRLNAIGRLGHAEAAVELFTSADADRARDIARDLDRLNRERQQMEREIVAQAEQMVVERGFHRDTCRGIVLAHREWHPGVIGIVAARLVERFGRPTVLIALNAEMGQGSGRSVRHFPLHEVLGNCAEHLAGFGGHAMAAGVRIDPRRIEAFTEAFLGEAAQRLTASDLRPKVHLDDEVELKSLQASNVELLSKLRPFGTGNPRPLLASRTVELAEPPRVMGSDGQHLSFTVREGNTYRRVVAFHRGDRAHELSEHRRLRLAFEPTINEWNGARRVELKAVDWQLER